MEQIGGQGGPPPGWYPDPEDPRQQRWWDGAGWTDNRMPNAGVSPAGWEAAPQQYGVPQYGAGGSPGAYAGVSGGHPGGAPAVGGDVRGLAVASLVLGIVGLVFAFLCWPIGIVCALIGLPMGGVVLSRISKGQGDPSARGMALTGTILSGIAIALSLVGLIWLGAFFAELSRL